jgi:hypothetical protein
MVNANGQICLDELVEKALLTEQRDNLGPLQTSGVRTDPLFAGLDRNRFSREGVCFEKGIS